MLLLYLTHIHLRFPTIAEVSTSHTHTRSHAVMAQRGGGGEGVNLRQFSDFPNFDANYRRCPLLWRKWRCGACFRNFSSSSSYCARFCIPSSQPLRVCVGARCAMFVWQYPRRHPRYVSSGANPTQICVSGCGLDRVICRHSGTLWGLRTLSSLKQINNFLLITRTEKQNGVPLSFHEIITEDLFDWQNEELF